ncbi:MAG TPA: hypothetical protein VK942_04600 [Actinomycetes bacterium]|nr:hypothetical protein [Actinomycetes bacterium]
MPARADAPAGTVAFETHNLGAEPHELVVVRADNPATLPQAADGTVDEQKLRAGALIGEVEAFPAKQTCAGTFALTPGRYALFCNILETEADGTRKTTTPTGCAPASRCAADRLMGRRPGWPPGSVSARTRCATPSGWACYLGHRGARGRPPALRPGCGGAAAVGQGRPAGGLAAAGDRRAAPGPRPGQCPGGHTEALLRERLAEVDAELARLAGYGGSSPGCSP